MQTVIECGIAQRLTAAGGQVVNGPAGLMGIFVSQASAVPTITVYDGPSVAGGALLVNTFTPAPGQFYPMPFLVTKGIFVLLSGTVDCTVSWGPVTA